MKHNIDVEKCKEFIKSGLTTKQIACELNIPWSTIKGIFRNLNLKTIHFKEFQEIKKESLQILIDKNYSIKQIAKELNCSQCKIKHWLKNHGLKTHAKWTIERSKIKKEIETGFKTCFQCKEKKSLTQENFYLKTNGKFHYWCKNCNDRISLEKQSKRKQLCVDYKGGKCFQCGYDKYIGALDFHHIDPKEKEFNISSLKTYAFEKIKLELDKCVCLCKNCHAETHHKLQKMVGPV